jgi:Cu/Ag efflux pump CusA
MMARGRQHFRLLAAVAALVALHASTAPAAWSQSSDSLFALIFSIGILVDDAIVVIENIARHWAMADGRSRAQAAIEAVAEVGNPTIVATLTVVAALLPMLFVSGLMGPYMAPIPANASAGMLLSFFGAVMVTPWLMLRIAGRAPAHAAGHDAHDGGWLGQRYARVARPILATRVTSWWFLGLVGAATLASLRLFAVKAGHREASAVRRQIRAAGHPRSAARRLARSDRSHATFCKEHHFEHEGWGPLCAKWWTSGPSRIQA